MTDPQKCSHTTRSGHPRRAPGLRPARRPPPVLAEKWDVTPTTVRRWCAEGRLPDAWRTSASHWRIPAEARRDFQPPAPRGGDRRSARYQRAREAL